MRVIAGTLAHASSLEGSHRSLTPDLIQLFTSLLVHFQRLTVLLATTAVDQSTGTGCARCWHGTYTCSNACRDHSGGMFHGNASLIAFHI